MDLNNYIDLNYGNNKLIGASLTDNTIDATQLDETGNYAFTGTVTGAGESNTPYFYGELSTAHDVTNGSSRKAQ